MQDRMQNNRRASRPAPAPNYPPAWRGEPRAGRSAPQDGPESRARRPMQQDRLEPPRARRSNQFRYAEPPLRPERPQPPRRRWRLLSLLGAAAALVVIAAVSLALLRSHAPAQSSASPTALPTPVATVYVPFPKDVLSSVSMVSPDDGWVVGSRPLGGNIGAILLLRYHAGRWEQISSPTSMDIQADSASPSQVVMLSASEGWAVGSLLDATTQAPFGFILHYSAGRWTLQARVAGIGLSGLAMPSASEGWAVGSTSQVGSGQQSVLLHYSGGTWTRVPSTGLTMDRIVMTSPSDGWIIGRTLPLVSSLVWHYNGTAWTPMNIPGMNPVSVISMVSGNDVWAIGAKATPGGARAALGPYGSFGGANVFEHYDGKTWSVVPTPTITQSINVTSLSLDASNDGWALGSQANPNGQAVVADTNLYLHYTGGKWTPVNGPAGDGAGLSVSMVSADDGWAVGDNGIILHYQQGAWNVVVNPAS